MFCVLISVKLQLSYDQQEKSRYNPYDTGRKNNKVNTP